MVIILASVLLAGGLGAIAYRHFRALRVANASDNLPAEPPQEVFQRPEPFAFLEQLTGEQLAELVREEHPRTVAVVLAQLQAPQAAQVLATLPADVQAEAIRCLASLAAMDARVLQEVRRGLAEKRKAIAAGAACSVGGMDQVVEILRHAGETTERNVMETLADRQPDMAKSLFDRMFAFEDLAELPPAQLGPALERIESDELAVAMRTADKQISKRIFAVLRPGVARRLRREMDQSGPVRLSDVESARRRVVEAVRQISCGQYAKTPETTASPAKT